MRLWTIWASAHDGTMWLEAAWDDDSTAENPAGYEEACKKAEKVAKENGGWMRVVAVDIPFDKIQAAFMPRAVKGTVA